MLIDTYASLDMGIEVNEAIVEQYLDKLDMNGDRKLSKE